MEGIYEYIETIKNELKEISCPIKSVNIDLDIFYAVFIEIGDTDEQLDDDVVKIFKKYKFDIFSATEDTATYCRGLFGILDEIRVNGLKELID